MSVETVDITAPSAALKASLANPRATGLLYLDVGSTAAEMGLAAGDIMVAFGAKPITDPASFDKAWVAAHKAKDVPVVLQRGTKTVCVALRVLELRRDPPSSMGVANRGAGGDEGNFGAARASTEAEALKGIDRRLLP